jgi:peptidoglycan pentaglycine glycine transferase (the first glycine)
MRIVHIDNNRKEEWNAFVSRKPFFGLLQSWEWGEFKQRLGWKVCRIAVEKQGRLEAGAQVLIRTIMPGLPGIAYVPRGPLVDWQDKETTSALLAALHSEARKQGAVCMRIEPPLFHTPANHSCLRGFGLQYVDQSNQPRCSLIVRLPTDMKELLKVLPSSTRRNIRLAQRKGVNVEMGTADDLSTFYRLQEITGKRNGYSIRSPRYYEQEWQTFHPLDQAQLLVARYQGMTIGVRMPFRFGEHAASFHSGYLKEYANLKAGYLMMWTAMCWAKSSGCRTFDLWGIPEEVGELTVQGQSIPEGKKEGLWGVYYFKRAFRGELVYYVGTYDYVFSPRLYRWMVSVAGRMGSVDKLAKIMDRLG